MQAAQLKNHSDPSWNLLTVDYLSPSAAEDFSRSLTETGFAIIKNHPIIRSQFEAVQKDWMTFFARTDKGAYLHKPPLMLGYFPFGSENAKNSPYKNLMEYYHYTPQVPLPAGVSEATERMFNQLYDLGQTILGWLDAQLPQSIRSTLSRPLTQIATNLAPHSCMRFIHYPALDTIETIEEGSLRSAPHEDLNLITLLCAASSPGLQVKDHQGNWHSVGTEFGQIVVNACDMLELATKGHYPSTTHQVVNPQGEAANTPRYSMPFFISCQPDVVLSPDFTADQFYLKRMQETGIDMEEA